MPKKFSYATAFSRNLGWVTVAEQERLRTCRVAIAGMGGVGGAHLLTLARLGVGRFSVADLDRFDIVNMNRQAGAFMSTMETEKTDTMTRMALDINPQADIRAFNAGVDASNVDEFLNGAELYVDALDMFAIPARRAVFSACQRLGIPAITVAPLGMGAALVNFLPGKMSFEDYFGLEEQSEDEQILRFLAGLAPRVLHRPYLVDPGRVNLANQQTASTAMGCQLSAGVMGSEALKILLGRGSVWSAPHAIQFDAYRNKLIHTWRPGGYRNPLQRVGLALLKRLLRRAAAQRTPTP
jgi:molybdopterin/thiamine biosynthesis adenylyltransferase